MEKELSLKNRIKKLTAFDYIIFFIFVCVLFGFISNVNARLGTFKQNECVDIVTVLNATSVTLTNVNYPSPNSSAVITNQLMGSDGNYFNYTFCNTSIYGVYTYGYCDDSGNCYSNDFVINGSGQEVSSSQINLLLIGLVIFLVVCAFFFILGCMFKHPGTKIFFMALSTLTLIILIGIITSNATVYLAEFQSIVSIYNQYYILIVILSGAAMLGLLVWLIAYSIKLFNKSRGRLDDED
jgi:hypothetical protein